MEPEGEETGKNRGFQSLKSQPIKPTGLEGIPKLPCGTPFIQLSGHFRPPPHGKPFEFQTIPGNTAKQKVTKGVVNRVKGEVIQCLLDPCTTRTLVKMSVMQKYYFSNSQMVRQWTELRKDGEDVVKKRGIRFATTADLKGAVKVQNGRIVVDFTTAYPMKFIAEAPMEIFLGGEAPFLYTLTPNVVVVEDLFPYQSQASKAKQDIDIVLGLDFFILNPHIWYKRADKKKGIIIAPEFLNHRAHMVNMQVAENGMQTLHIYVNGIQYKGKEYSQVFHCPGSALNLCSRFYAASFYENDEQSTTLMAIFTVVIQLSQLRKQWPFDQTIIYVMRAEISTALADDDVARMTLEKDDLPARPRWQLLWNTLKSVRISGVPVFIKHTSSVPQYASWPMEECFSEMSKSAKHIGSFDRTDLHFDLTNLRDETNDLGITDTLIRDSLNRDTDGDCDVILPYLVQNLARDIDKYGPLRPGVPNPPAFLDDRVALCTYQKYKLTKPRKHNIAAYDGNLCICSPSVTSSLKFFGDRYFMHLGEWWSVPKKVLGPMHAVADYIAIEKNAFAHGMEYPMRPWIVHTVQELHKSIFGECPDSDGNGSRVAKERAAHYCKLVQELQKQYSPSSPTEMAPQRPYIECRRESDSLEADENITESEEEFWGMREEVFSMMSMMFKEGPKKEPGIEIKAEGKKSVAKLWEERKLELERNKQLTVEATDSLLKWKSDITGRITQLKDQRDWCIDYLAKERIPGVRQEPKTDRNHRQDGKKTDENLSKEEIMFRFKDRLIQDENQGYYNQFIIKAKRSLYQETGPGGQADRWIEAQGQMFGPNRNYEPYEDKASDDGAMEALEWFCQLASFEPLPDIAKKNPPISLAGRVAPAERKAGSLRRKSRKY